MLLNPDCELLDDALRPRWPRSPPARAARCTRRACSTRAGSSARRIRCPGPPARCSPRRCRPRCCRARARERLEPWRAGRPVSVGWAIGACLAADTAALRRLGPFDPAVHLFAEDMDLCLRARALGDADGAAPGAGRAPRRRSRDAPRRRAVRPAGAAAARRGRRDPRPPRARAGRRRPGAHVRLARRGPRAARRRRAAPAAPARRRSAARCADERRRRARGRRVRRARRRRARAARLAAGARPPGRARLPARGRSPSAAADAGLDVEPLADRPLALRGRGRRRAARPRGACAPTSRGWPARTARTVVVASGQRPLLAAARPLRSAARAGSRSCTTSRPARRSARRCAAACRRADAIVATSGAIARAADPAARRLGRTHVIHPGVDLAHWARRRRRRRVRRARSASARSCRGSGPTSRWRSRRGCPSCGSTSRARRCRATRPASRAALRERAARARPARPRAASSAPSPTRAPRSAEAHVLLHCADAEPFGLALVEALAAGRPVAAPAAGGPLEIVTPACGRLYAPGDADAGAAAVRAAARRRRPRRRRPAQRAAAFARRAPRRAPLRARSSPGLAAH